MGLEDRFKEDIATQTTSAEDQQRESIANGITENLQYVFDAAKAMAEQYSARPEYGKNLSRILQQYIISLHEVILDVEGNHWEQQLFTTPQGATTQYHRKNNAKIMTLDEFARAVFIMHLDFISATDKNICMSAKIHFEEKYHCIREGYPSLLSRYADPVARRRIEDLKITYQ